MKQRYNRMIKIQTTEAYFFQAHQERKQSNFLFRLSSRGKQLYLISQITKNWIILKQLKIRQSSEDSYIKQCSDDGNAFYRMNYMETAKYLKSDDYQFYYIQKSNLQLLQDIDNQLKDKQAEFTKKCHQRALQLD
ncbi:hypothetical protein pb186bvf_007190 [Paramecium bursaria]